MFEQVRCPETACTGWVCEVEDRQAVFFGCGECGNVWQSEDNLARAIELAIGRNPYRLNAYIPVGGYWRSNPSGSMAAGYDENISKERCDVG